MKTTTECLPDHEKRYVCPNFYGKSFDGLDFVETTDKLISDIQNDYSYRQLTDEQARQIADLFLNHNEDVYEVDGKFYTAAELVA